MKKTPLYSTITVLTFFLLISCSPDNIESDKNLNIIKVGALLPLTGDAAIYGDYTKSGILLGLEKVNQTLSSKNMKLEVVFEDSKAEAKTGVTATQKLINANDVIAIIDDSVSSVTLAVAPICEKNNVVLLSTGATAPSITNAGDFIFRIWNSDSLEGKVTGNFTTNGLKAHNVAILSVNNAYGSGLAGVFKSTIAGNDSNIVLELSFNETETNYRTYLNKIKNINPDVIYLVAYPQQARAIFQQAKELNVSNKWVGTVGLADPKLIDFASELGLELHYPMPKQADPNNPFVKDFLTSYKEVYKTSPPPLADVGYDAITIIGDAISNLTDPNGTQLQTALNSLPGKYMSSGYIEFDKNGDVNKAIQMIKVH